MSQKNKKRGKNTKAKVQGQKRDILFAEDGQIYATVEKILGNCRVLAKCTDGKTRLCHIRGKMKKRVWIREDSVILIGLRDFEDDKADVIHCYLPEEVRRLICLGEMPDTEDKPNNNDDAINITWDSNIVDEKDTKLATKSKTIDSKTDSKTDSKSNSKSNLDMFNESDSQHKKEDNFDNEIDFL